MNTRTITARVATLAGTYSFIASVAAAWSAEPTAPAAAVPGSPAGAVAASSATNGLGPRIHFPTNLFDFGKVVGGEPAKVTINFTNTGDKTLEVTAVQPSCGCTTAGDWTHKLEPGQGGTIPLQFNSGGYAGGMVQKAVTVVCNDPTQPSVMLQIRGTVWHPIEVNPLFAVMNVPADVPTNINSVVHVVDNLDTPLTIYEVKSSSSNFVAELQTNQPGKDFSVIIRPVPPLAAGNVQGLITLKSKAGETNQPDINITALAMVQAAVMAIPNQIILPAGSISNKLPVTVTIQNNVSAPLTLSDPTVNAQGVDVEVKETQPGKLFAVTLNFPEGFSIPPGQNEELTVKTSNPQYAALRVPIIQPVSQPPANIVIPIKTIPTTTSQAPAPAAPVVR